VCTGIEYQDIKKAPDPEGKRAIKHFVGLMYNYRNIIQRKFRKGRYIGFKRVRK
jgi:hypothetical protein